MCESTPYHKSTACPLCKKKVKKNDNSIACYLCDLWYHAKCLKLPSEVYNFLAKETDSAKHGLFQWLCPSRHGEAPKTLCMLQTNELINVVNAQNHKIENLEIQMAKLISIIGATFDQLDLKFGQIQNGGDVKNVVIHYWHRIRACKFSYHACAVYNFITCLVHLISCAIYLQTRPQAFTFIPCIISRFCTSLG